MFYEIQLARPGKDAVVLGTAPTEEAIDEWFGGAYVAGLLPDTPSYMDEIQVFEVVEGHRFMKWVWRLSWHQFEAKRIV